MKKITVIISIVSVLIISLIISVLFTASVPKEKRNQNNDFSKAMREEYHIFAPQLPDSLDFCGEKVPLNNYLVHEYLDREIVSNTFRHSSTILVFKRAYRFFPIIDSILEKNNIPPDFRYLCVIESDLLNLTSPAGAKGYWQFMKSTGISYGLEINSQIDERLCIYKSTEAACQYLKDAYNKFGSWTLAAASYNMGMAGLQNKLNQQKTDNYYDLLLCLETTRYLNRILAMKYIMENPTKYGFYFREADFYPPIPTKAIVIESSINNLVDFALENKITYRILKDLNPWLTSTSLNVKYGKKYTIRVPKANATLYSELLKNIPNDKIYRDSIDISSI